MPFSSDLQYVVDLARGAGKVALSHYGHVDRLTKTHAATTDEAVTIADRETQRFIVAGLRKRFPNDGLIGEESDTGQSITFEVKDPAGRNWVIDPIDGTNNFISGANNFAVCIGLLEKGSPTLGVVYDVTRDLMYAAAKGEGAWVNDRRIRVLDTPLSDATVLMLTSNLLDKVGGCPKWAVRWIGQTAWKVRMLGSAALETIAVAAGVAHGSVTVNGKLWDAVAPAAIAIEAGARFTDLKGGEIFPYDLNGYIGAKVPFLCAGRGAYDQLLAELKNC